ncbi:hypothetical protein [Clostridium thermarum]|uniref:hypothetical protein n=1 Tax=Clostridium thermarum TaxID=1716543 RepID=UPI0011208D5C|nr:hypothetical protein [Clostridium thermarum]
MRKNITKKMFAFLLTSVVILSSPLSALAADIKPMYVPCYYWEDGRHRYYKVDSYMEYRTKAYTHPHYMNGVNFNCTVIADILHDKYQCLCGEGYETKTYYNEDHRVGY